MLNILYGSQMESRRQEFDQLFKARFETFVVGRGWSLPSYNGRERDQFDKDCAVYFIDRDKNGEIVGSVRITPTDRCSLLADCFPHISNPDPAPRSPHIYEATRYISLPKEKSRAANRASKARVIAAAMIWCFEHQVSRLQSVIDVELLDAFMEMCPYIKVMGPTSAYGGGRGVPGGGMCLGISAPVHREAIEAILHFGNLDPNEFPIPVLSAA
ncbi:acyl-homoserine-lactone synthase [Cohaesibacter gelatinilyticus]|uniref:Acyl-homoserine lactone synthase n=1 Tax=Cohaesibacter gelatinilyticus TaxID=372072 RepID=A0A285PH67_9HYPH|nr:acyl-homoserine-lactone synthase [Cohaesibacter gelatinilyticus]SNZ21072.1 acyl-homoserine lactone synthase [Cohaesibacter gelatinilyticus]